MTDRAALMSMFDYDARPVTPGVILVGTIGAQPGQGQPVMMGAVAAEQRGLSRNRCRPSAYSVPIASDVLPDPDRPRVGSVQGWTGALGPRSRRSDCMMANEVVRVKISMSAAASTPVYLAMTGAAVRSVTSSR